jgi:hypothetical protein
MIRTSAALIAALTLFGAVSANAQGSATPTQGNPASTRSAPNTPATTNSPATTGAGPAVRTAPNEAIGGRVPGMANPDRAPASTQDHEPPSK